jgi:hypothetical protein
VPIDYALLRHPFCMVLGTACCFVKANQLLRAVGGGFSRFTTSINKDGFYMIE